MNSKRRISQVLGTILVVLCQLVPSVSAIAETSATSSPVERITQEREASSAVASAALMRQPGEPQEVYFARVGKANPELLQAAFLQALQEYLNKADNDLSSEDDFYRTVERYISPQPADWRDHIVRFLKSQRSEATANSQSTPGATPPASPSSQSDIVSSSPDLAPIDDTQSPQQSIEATTAILTVNDLGDASDAAAGNGVCATAEGTCTLRAAIQEANTLAGADTIAFTVVGTITLAEALPMITSDLAINGPGAAQLTISGAGSVDIFRVWDEAGQNAVTLQGLTIADGSSEGSGGLTNFRSRLTIRDCTFSNNSGAISNHGVLTVQESTFSNNSSNGYAGAIRNDGGTLTIQDSTFHLNSAELSGGAVYNTGVLTIERSTFADNHAGGYFGDGGGGIMNYGQATIENSTFAGNTAVVSEGGGLCNGAIGQAAGTAIIRNSTFSGNSDGIISVDGATVTLRNSIVANSTPGVNCSSSGVNGSGNLVWGDTTCPGNVFVDPLLAPLGNYGGKTQTFALLPGSAAIDMGNSYYCPATDQRGVPRGANCDYGAFESRGFTLAVASGDNQTTLINTAFAKPLTVQVSSNVSPPEPVDGGRIVFVGPEAGAGTYPIINTATVQLGLASVSVTANESEGSYQVEARPYGANQAVFFHLTQLLRLPTVTPTATPTATVTPIRTATSTVEPKTVAALRAGVRPAIDGDPVEWQALTGTSLNKDNAGSIGGSDMNPSIADLSANLRAAWAPEALYFAATITDDVLVGNNSTYIWGDDVLELGIRVGSTSHQFTLAVDGRTTDLGNPITSLTYVTRTVPGGWTLEVAVPATALGLTTLATGQQYPFTFGLWDDDLVTYPGQTHMIWQGTSTGAYQPAWGTLSLSSTAYDFPLILSAPARRRPSDRRRRPGRVAGADRDLAQQR